MTTQNLVHAVESGRWEQAIYAFLAEKERRSGSMRTVRAYSGMLYRFFGTLGKPPDDVTATEVFGYAHGTGRSGKKPSSVTVNARIACLSSFYRFLIRMSLVNANPCDQLERPRATPAPPRGLAAADIKKLLDVIPGSPVGLRDRGSLRRLICVSGGDGGVPVFPSSVIRTAGPYNNLAKSRTWQGNSRSDVGRGDPALLTTHAPHHSTRRIRATSTRVS